jgi:glyceraldehyde 3-phosphate dehydrogenase
VGISEVLNLFDYAHQVGEKPSPSTTSAELASTLLELDLAPSKLDIGRLTHEYLTASPKPPALLTS